VGATEYTDIELLQWISRGDAAAFEALYERYRRAVLSFCLRLMRDLGDAEEVTQEAFLRIWSQAARFDSTRGSAATWLFAIAHHLVIDHVRRHRTDAIPSSPEVDVVVAASPDDPAERAVTEVYSSRIRRAVHELAPEQRKAIWLTYFAGLTHREAAGALVLPLGTVKSRVRLGLQHLRRSVGPDFSEHECDPEGAPVRILA